MIQHAPFDGWGNMLLQQCFVRALSEKTDYYVSSRKIPYLINSGDYNLHGERVDSPVVEIGHKSEYRHYVDMDALLDMAPCKFHVRSYLEHYPNIMPYKEQIVNDWVYINNPYNTNDISSLHGKFYKHNGSAFSPVTIDNVTSRDLVLSIRLGRDYLGMHRYRLLLGDYFKIILDRVDYDRLFITSQDPMNGVLRDLYRYDPIFLDHISPMHTFNFVRLFNNIVLSQSTYSWWAAYLSEADNIYFPITLDGPWSYGKNQNPKWARYKHDLMVNEDRYKYVSYVDRDIIGDYTTTRACLFD